jgi:lipoate synthase
MVNKFEVVNKKTGEKKQFTTLREISKHLGLSYAVCSRIVRKAYNSKLQNSTKELLDTLDIIPISPEITL